MAEFLVTWEIQLDADSPEDAAELALKIQQDPDAIAHVFHVSGGPDGPQTIDLDRL